MTIEERKELIKKLQRMINTGGWEFNITSTKQAIEELKRINQPEGELMVVCPDCECYFDANRDEF